MSACKIKLSPSMMCADFLHLDRELCHLEKFGVEWLHIDVMDGHYVPNFTLGFDYCKAIAAATSIPLDIHLMIEHPEAHIESFCSLPGARLCFHPETVRQPLRLLARIRELGASPGIALDPSQPVEQFRHIIPLADQIVIMTVNPGYAGQKLLPHCIKKIAEARDFITREGLKTEIEVDGNVSFANIPGMVQAGANILVLGTSALFEKHRSREESFKEVSRLLASMDCKVH